MNSPPLHSSLTIEPVGIVRSCFADKFGVPRQPGLCRHAQGHIVLLPPYNRDEAFRGLETFSHLWLSFIFHQTPEGPFKPLIRPPRLGGNQKVGVFASRSPFRPNRLGLSVVRQHGLFRENGELCLRVSGLDLVDGTPVVDIKPYLPWCDAPEDACAEWADAAPALIPVHFAPQAEEQALALEGQYPALMALITDLLSQDPRPAYKKGQSDHKIYTARLYNIDVHWKVTDQRVTVHALAPIT